MGGIDSKYGSKYNLMELFCPETSKNIYDGGESSIYYDGSHWYFCYIFLFNQNKFF